MWKTLLSLSIIKWVWCIPVGKRFCVPASRNQAWQNVTPACLSVWHLAVWVFTCVGNERGQKTGVRKRLTSLKKPFSPFKGWFFCPLRLPTDVNHHMTKCNAQASLRRLYASEMTSQSKKACSLGGKMEFQNLHHGSHCNTSSKCILGDSHRE